MLAVVFSTIGKSFGIFTETNTMRNHMRMQTT